MAIIRPFQAIRPATDLVDQVTTLPYAVLNDSETRAFVKGHPHSFMRVDRAEAFLPPESPAEHISAYAAEELARMRQEGVFLQDPSPCLYIYRQIFNRHIQTGVVCCTGVEDYCSRIIKQHELTLAPKEEACCSLIQACGAHTSPVFLTYRHRAEIDALVADLTLQAPTYDFFSDDIHHTVWQVNCPRLISRLQTALAAIDSMYIADGHHRAASAVRVAQRRRAENPAHTGEEPYNFFLSVLIPDNQLQIMDYNRVLADLGDYTPEGFRQALQHCFDLTEYGVIAPKITNKHTFGLLMEDRWWLLRAKDDSFPAQDLVGQLDVSILQHNVLEPLLHITDVRRDNRIRFSGGYAGMRALEKEVREGAAAAFALCPTSIADLLAVADAGCTMPPKSTWFEPKLGSGIFLHDLI